MVDRDVELFHSYGAALADAVEAALPGWVRRSVEQRLPSGNRDADLEADIESAGRTAATRIGGRLRELLAADIDEQWTNPLSVLRAAVGFPTAILAARGVPPMQRDRDARRIHPDDAYDLTPGGFADFGPDVHEHGIKWGAAKAHLHLRRRSGS